MDKKSLKNLGIQLRESMTTVSNFESLVKDLKAKLSSGEEVLLKAKKVNELAYSYSFQKSQKLKEEAIEVKKAEDVWASGKDASKTYISNRLYFVKKIEDGLKYEVTIEDGTQRKSFATLSKAELDKSFTPIRPNQNPDAEGYVQYRDVDEVDAFKYSEDTIKVDVGEPVLINKGDYLIRSAKGDNFVYEVKKAKDFEATFTPK